MIDIDLSTLKEFLRIDGTGEDEFLGFLVEAAKQDLENSGVHEDRIAEKDEKIYQLAVMMLVTHWYENRMTVTEAKNSQRPMIYGLESIIIKLKSYGGE